MTLEEVLLKHYNCYPKMQIQDMVKLIYQNEFGGGHLIKNKDDSLLKLEEEFCLLRRYSSNINIHVSELFEDIGNNLLRLNLFSILKKKNNKENNTCIELSTINNFFVNTANSISGKKERFEEKLEILKKCCRDRLLSFSIIDVEDYLKEYKAKGYPIVSHSEIYRSTYLPSYRIVECKYRDFFEIFCRVDSLLKTKDRVNVAIDGNCSAGKSTLADFIGNIYDCNIFHMDDFFLPPEIRTQERLNEVGGNVDYVRFKNEVIEGINSGMEFQYRKYNCKLGKFQEIKNVKPKKLNIIEGSYSMHPTLIENYDLKIFLQIDEEEQRRRILKRNGLNMYKMFVELWIPLENRYFSEMRIKEQSDLVFTLKYV